MRAFLIKKQLSSILFRRNQAMSAHDESDRSSDEASAASAAADEVRKGFAALPFEEQIVTLLRIEFDMVGDVVETVFNAATRAMDEIVETFSSMGQADCGTADGDATPV